MGLLDRSEIVANRFRKAAALRAAGRSPFAHKWNPLHTSAEILDRADEMIADQTSPARVAGRVLVVRDFGKSAFFHLQDEAGKIQVYAQKNRMGEEGFQFFKSYVDGGDIVGVEGPVFRTKTGEVTIAATTIELLTKAMRPLPEKWHGLRDVETRYRRRYVDLIVNEDSRRIFRNRSRLIRALRNWLDDRGFLEVETPMMQPIYGGASARPFVTHHNTLDMTLYLRIAPELYLKRLLVGGFEKVYEINRNFRNEGISTRHNPEFTMLELYRAYWNYEDMMGLVEEMFQHAARSLFGTLEFTYQGRRIDMSGPFRRVSILDAVREKTGLTFQWSDEPGDVRERMAQVYQPAHGLSTPAMIMELFEELVEPDLLQPVFVTEYPTEVCPLAKCKPGDPLVAERFELYVGGLELANGYSELNDPEDQYARFEQQVRMRQSGDEEAAMMDEDYVLALEHGMPPAAGLGVGIDRLVMLLTDSASIRDVILFPLLRPQQPGAENVIENEESETGASAPNPDRGDRNDENPTGKD
ncbi:MAG: lysine--tRNA ligase [Candidatus Sumerlaeia bacterium]